MISYSIFLCHNPPPPLYPSLARSLSLSCLGKYSSNLFQCPHWQYHLVILVVNVRWVVQTLLISLDCCYNAMDMDRPFLHRHNSHKLTTVGWERTVANDEPFTIEHGMGISDILFLQFDDGESHIWRERQQSVTANGNNTPAKKNVQMKTFDFLPLSGCGPLLLLLLLMLLFTTANESFNYEISIYCLQDKLIV